MEGGAPRPNANGNPTVAFVAFRQSDAEIIDNWDTLGLRATGSHDLLLNEVFVPDQRTAILGGPWDHPASQCSGPLYRLKIWLDPLRIGVTALGIARAALDKAVALTASKAPNGFTTLLADKGVVQDKLARAQALLSAGRDTVYVQAGKAWDYAQSGQSISPVEGLPLGLAGTFAVQAAIQVVDIVQDVAGTTGIRRSQDFQRYFRDVHTLAQHALANSSRFESLGKLMLGRESDFGFYYV